MPTSPPKSPQAPQFLKSPQRRQAPRPGRRIRHCGRVAARPAWRALLLAGAAAAMLGMPAVAQAAVSPDRAAAPASLVLRAAATLPAATTLPAGPAGLASPAGAALPASGVATTAVQIPAQPAAPSGGICSVPGIGDIGGLLGFCAAGSSGIIGDLNNICQPSVPPPSPPPVVSTP
jgi:hypothetical protein